MDKNYFMGVATVVIVMLIFWGVKSLADHNEEWRNMKYDLSELTKENNQLKADTTKYRHELVKYYKNEDKSDYEIQNIMSGLIEK